MLPISSRRAFIQQLSTLVFCTSNVYRDDALHNINLTRIGYINGAGLTNLDLAFNEELSKLGFKDNENIIIEKQLIEPNTPATNKITDLLQKNISLMVVSALPFALEVRKINPDMPMVIITCPGMVSNGFAQTLQHPGGNYTGIDELPPGIISKRLQLLKTAVPSVSRVGLLSTTPGKGGHEWQLAEAEKEAALLGIGLSTYRATSLPQLEQALTDLVKDGMNGMLCFQGGLSLANRQHIVEVMAHNSIPAIYQSSLFVEAGGLMSWSPNLELQFREASRLVAKILNGTKPGDLAIKHPEKYYLTLNKITAEKTKINFPKELLTAANRIIE